MVIAAVTEKLKGVWGLVGILGFVTKSAKDANENTICICAGGAATFKDVKQDRDMHYDICRRRHCTSAAVDRCSGVVLGGF